MKILWVYVLMYGLNLIDVILINYDTREVCQARIGINLLTIIPIVYALFKIEGHTIKKGLWRFAYYLAFVCASLLDGFSCWTEDYDPFDDEIAADRVLRTRASEDSNREYTMLPEEMPIHQCTRFAYAILILFGMVKILRRFQISEGLSFMIKMLQRTMVEIIPFAKMFLSFIVMFMFAIHALNVPTADTNNSDDYANI
jgi:Polycystin cation channel